MKIFLTLLFLIASGQFSFSQLNYREIFGEDWIRAEKSEKDNRVWIEPLLNKSHISYPLAMAVIFPELIRYSALRDKMETALLKTLYVNLGEDYANFSIGDFQMKPSFAEMIRSEAPESFRRKVSFKKISDFDNIKDYRKSIIKDLESGAAQVNYLIAFIKICDKRFKANRKEEYSKVLFLSAAYNYGFDKPESKIVEMIHRKYFNTKLIKGENYCYSDISLYWYKDFLSAGK